MITLKEAADKVMLPYNSSWEIGSISDIGDSWIFGIRDKATKEGPECSCGDAVRKDTGEVWYCFPPDHPELFTAAKIPLSALKKKGVKK